MTSSFSSLRENDLGQLGSLCEDEPIAKEGKSVTSKLKREGIQFAPSKQETYPEVGTERSDGKENMDNNPHRGLTLKAESQRNLLRTLENHYNGKAGKTTAKSVLQDSSFHESLSNLTSVESDVLQAENYSTSNTSCPWETTITKAHNVGNLDVELQILRQELEAAKHKIAEQEEALCQARVSCPVAKSVSLLAPSEIFEDQDLKPSLEIDKLCIDPNSFNKTHEETIKPCDKETCTESLEPSKETASCTSQFQSNRYTFISNPSTWSNSVNCNWSNRTSDSAATFLNVSQPLAQNYRDRSFGRSLSPATSSGSRTMLEDFNSNTHCAESHRASLHVPGPSTSITPSAHRDIWESGAGFAYPSTGFNTSYHQANMFPIRSTTNTRSGGTTLSASAQEFTLSSNIGPWNLPASTIGQTYVPTTEPLNYRRLLDRSVSCNWRYIVDKIVCNNDQQASIFLQQKLKVGTVEQKYDIVQSIVAQAYPLMINRFGNFLVQRCFEHGTPEQVVAIANAIRGNTLNLSMDPFGCHVVQKAFDAVPEECKAVMVHELLRRIPETVIHRYACHVWQKLFELRWNDSPPQIMKYVNEALAGMWHEVALGETGSLVVQNIFENCLEEDKRPCVNEVLKSIDIIAHGQFGNWCIQHICEHGAPADKSQAVDHVLLFATEYSMDQFASKVVEKCLKIGGADFLERYLDRVCTGRSNRPRIPLIDIASDQYGNYLIQYILTHANAPHREVVASHIRKHMVSLRGSKFGSRVGMLCSNPAYATRPGHGAGASSARFSGTANSSARYSNQFR